jgi:formate hydrogenlyase subunit 4
VWIADLGRRSWRGQGEQLNESVGTEKVCSFWLDDALLEMVVEMVVVVMVVVLIEVVVVVVLMRFQFHRFYRVWWVLVFSSILLC